MCFEPGRLTGLNREGNCMPNKLWSYFDPLSFVVIALTLVLFVIALFVKGFTQELLQE